MLEQKVIEKVKDLIKFNVAMDISENPIEAMSDKIYALKVKKGEIFLLGAEGTYSLSTIPELSRTAILVELLDRCLFVKPDSAILRELHKVPTSLVDYEEYKKLVVEELQKKYKTIKDFLRDNNSKILDYYQEHKIDILKMSVVLRSSGPKNVKFLSACAKCLSLPGIETHRVNINYCYLVHGKVNK